MKNENKKSNFQMDDRKMLWTKEKMNHSSRVLKKHKSIKTINNLFET